MATSRGLLVRMRRNVATMESLLNDEELAATVQLDDINVLCWEMIELTQKLYAAVHDELATPE